MFGDNNVSQIAEDHGCMFNGHNLSKCYKSSQLLHNTAIFNATAHAIVNPPNSFFLARRLIFY